ncbi:MAG TPA: hypothetical protein VGG48_14960 [Rhizomicrobium sp.]
MALVLLLAAFPAKAGVPATDAPQAASVISVDTGQEIDAWTLAICSSDDTASVVAYQRLRNALTGKAFLSGNLDRTGKDLQREWPSCSQPMKAILMAELMRLLGEDWSDDGNLARADAAYRNADRYEASAQKDDLQKIAILQDWARLKVRMHATGEARKMAVLQTSIANADYLAHPLAASLLVFNLRFEAEILDETGGGQAGEVKRAEAGEIEKKEVKCSGVCSWDGSPMPATPH